MTAGSVRRRFSAEVLNFIGPVQPIGCFDWTGKWFVVVDRAAGGLGQALSFDFAVPRTWARVWGEVCVLCGRTALVAVVFAGGIIVRVPSKIR